jgi:hypothetical protein
LCNALCDSSHLSSSIEISHPRQKWQQIHRKSAPEWSLSPKEVKRIEIFYLVPLLPKLEYSPERTVPNSSIFNIQASGTTQLDKSSVKHSSGRRYHMIWAKDKPFSSLVAKEETKNLPINFTENCRNVIWRRRTPSLRSARPDFCAGDCSSSNCARGSRRSADARRLFLL